MLDADARMTGGYFTHTLSLEPDERVDQVQHLGKIR